MPVAIVDGTPQTFAQGETFQEVHHRSAASVPQVCCHPRLGPIQTCDTCIVEAHGKLVRSCATPATDGILVVMESRRAHQALQRAVGMTLGSERKPVIEPPGLFSLLVQFRLKELRRSVSLINRFFESFGHQLKWQGAPSPKQ